MITKYLGHLPAMIPFSAFPEPGVEVVAVGAMFIVHNLVSKATSGMEPGKGSKVLGRKEGQSEVRYG